MLTRLRRFLIRFDPFLRRPKITEIPVAALTLPVSPVFPDRTEDRAQ